MRVLQWLGFVPSEENTLYTYYARNPTWPATFDGLLQLCAGVFGIIANLFSLVSVFDPASFQGLVFILIALVMRGAMFLIAMLVAVDAAQFAHKETHSETQEILQTTLLSRKNIYDALLYATFVRHRTPIGLIVAGYSGIAVSAVVSVLLSDLLPQFASADRFAIPAYLLLLAYDISSFYCRIKLAASMGTVYGMSPENDSATAITWAIIGQLVIEFVISLFSVLMVMTYCLILILPFLLIQAGREMPERWRERVGKAERVGLDAGVVES